MLASAELYDSKTGKFSPTGSMTTGRDQAGATLLPDGRVLIAGGGNEGLQDGRVLFIRDDDPSSSEYTVSSAWLFDPATGKLSPAGSLATPRRFYSATTLLDGRVLIAGGYTQTYETKMVGTPPTTTSEQVPVFPALNSAELYQP
jgi:hypothetical protein